MTDEERLRALLREARVEGECSTAIEDRLREAFRKRHRRRLWPAWAVGAAAAAAVVLMMLPKPRPEPPAAVAKVEQPARPAPVVGADVRLEKQPPPLRRIRRARSGREVATPFYALDAGIAGQSPSGYVMRVKVPRATMASFGLPVNQDFVDQRVDADVLMGSDGTARAIRFVRVIQ